MGKKRLLNQLRDAILKCETEEIVKVANEYIKKDHDPKEALSKALTPSMRELGNMFDRGEIFLPELMVVGKAVREASEILLKETPSEEKKKYTIVLGTVEGDVHDIGKSILAMLLEAEGMNVIDLGRDVPIEKFVKVAREKNADIVGSSALMTTTRPGHEKIRKKLEEEGIKSKVLLMIGGAPATQGYADKIGADSYAENALEAVDKVYGLMEQRG